MKKSQLLGLSALVAVGAFAVISASAGEQKQKREEAAEKSDTVKLSASPQRRQMQVQNEAELKRALDLAARDTTQQIDITCHPPDHDWCANNFQQACADNGGGLSTEPDGGITCSMPDA